jgi:hypothetical protein
VLFEIHPEVSFRATRKQLNGWKRPGKLCRAPDLLTVGILMPTDISLLGEARSF